MPMHCKAPWCPNKLQSKSRRERSSSWVSYHSFPKDHERRLLWCKLVGINISSVKDGSALCSDHFSASQFINRHKKLQVKKYAVPYNTNPGLIKNMNPVIRPELPVKSSSTTSIITNATTCQSDGIPDSTCARLEIHMKKQTSIRPKEFTAPFQNSEPIMYSSGAYILGFGQGQPAGVQIDPFAQISSGIGNYSSESTSPKVHGFSKIYGELKTMESALRALRNCEARLSIALEWITQSYGKVPDDLEADLEAADSVEFESNPKINESQASFSSNIGFNQKETPPPPPPLVQNYDGLSNYSAVDPLPDVMPSIKIEEVDVKPDAYSMDLVVETGSDLLKSVGIRSISEPEEMIHESATFNIVPIRSQEPQRVSLKCTVCDMTFGREMELRAHSLLAHPVPSVTMIPAYKRKRKNYRKPRPTLQLKCTFCDEVFDREIRLRAHSIMTHPIEVPTCKRCGETIEIYKVHECSASQRYAYGKKSKISM